MSPDARSRSIGGAAGIGVSNAMGRPRSVTSIVSPASTLRRNSLALWRSSLIPIRVIVLLVALISAKSTPPHDLVPNRLRTECTDYLLEAGQAVGVQRFVVQATTPCTTAPAVR